MNGWHFWEAIRWDLPALVLAALLIGFAVSLYLVQRRNDFDFAQMYLDENGKPSTVRVLSVGAWVASTWYVMQDMLDGVPTPEVFWGYVITWSGAKVLEKGAEKWNGSLPFGK